LLDFGVLRGFVTTGRRPLARELGKMLAPSLEPFLHGALRIGLLIARRPDLLGQLVLPLTFAGLQLQVSSCRSLELASLLQGCVARIGLGTSSIGEKFILLYQRFALLASSAGGRLACSLERGSCTSARRSLSFRCLGISIFVRRCELRRGSVRRALRLTRRQLSVVCPSLRSRCQFPSSSEAMGGRFGSTCGGEGFLRGTGELSGAIGSADRLAAALFDLAPQLMQGRRTTDSRFALLSPLTRTLLSLQIFAPSDVGRDRRLPEQILSQLLLSPVLLTLNGFAV